MLKRTSPCGAAVEIIALNNLQAVLRQTCTALHFGDALAGKVPISVSFTGGQQQDYC